MRLLSQILFFAAVTAVAFTAPAASPLRGWYEQWPQARRAAEQRGIPLLVVFSQQNCPECYRMECALATAVSQSALRNAVKLRLDCREYPQLVRHFGVNVTPTLLLTTPESNYQDDVYRQEGALTVSQILSLGRCVDSLLVQRQSETASEEKHLQPSHGSSQNEASALSRPRSSTRDTRSRKRSPDHYGYYVYASRDAALCAARENPLQ